MTQCIKKIEINHFKGLYGKYEIDLTKNGNNLMLYGKDGSGKSSFAKAIKLFFQSADADKDADEDADEDIDISQHENIFIPNAQQNTAYIKLTFGEKGNKYSAQTYELSNKNHRQTENFIIQANKIKGFLDYKSLLRTHFLKKPEVNVFELLVNTLLADFIGSRSQNTIKEDWKWLTDNVRDKRTTKYKNELIPSGGRLEKFNSDQNKFLVVVLKTNNNLFYKFDLEFLLKYDFHPNDKIY